MSKPTLYTLREEEELSVALNCVIMTAGLMKHPEFKQTAMLTGDFQIAFVRLEKALVALEDKNGEMQVRDLNLDIEMAFALIHAIVQSFYRMKGHILLPKSQRKNGNDEGDEIEELYEELKDPAADLLWQLTEAWNYIDYGLKTLEEVFDRKPVTRPLPDDNKETVFTVTINEGNQRLFNFGYTWLDSLKHYQEESDFAHRLFHCRFIHPTDYERVKNKLLNKYEGAEIPLTLAETIIFYQTLSLLGKMFVSDADFLFDKIAKQVDESLTIKTTSRDTRNYFLKFSDEALSMLKKEFRHNKTFMLEIDRVKNW